LFQDHKEGEKNMKMPLKKSFRTAKGAVRVTQTKRKCITTRRAATSWYFRG